MPKLSRTRHGIELSTEHWRDLPLADVVAVQAGRLWRHVRVMCPQCGRRLRVPLRAFTIRPDATLASDRSLVCAADDAGVPTDGCGAAFPVQVPWAGLAG